MTARPLDLRLLQQGRSVYRPLGGAVITGIAAGLLVLWQAVLLASVISRVFIDGEQLSDVQSELVLLLIALGARAIVTWMRQLFSVRAASKVKRSLRHDLLAAILQRGWGGSDFSGETAITAIQGVDALDAYFARYVPQLVLGATVPVVGIVWIATIDRLSAVILVLTIPLIPVFMVLIGGIADQQTEKRWNRMQTLGGAFQEMVRGMTTLRIFGRTQEWLDRLRYNSEELRRETMATLRVAFLSALVLELLATIGTALIAVAVGLRVLYSQIDLAPALTVLIMAPEVYLPLRRVGVEFHSAMEGVKAADTAFRIIDSAPRFTGEVPAPSAAECTIDIENVAVNVEGRALLSPLSLSIEPREFVAIVGRSGAGKTTLARVLMGFAKPSQGHVLVGGVELSQIAEETWWDQIAYLAQEPYLRAGSIRENLLMGDATAAESRLWGALHECDLGGFVSSLPDGLDTAVGEGGKLLSAGQRRLLALARVLVRRSPLVILDEPTANVDRPTQRLLADAIERLSHSATVVLIVHDPDLAARADRRIEVGR